MTDRARILAINPGSTSTKISLFEDESEVWSAKLSHSREELAPYEKIIDQYAFREGVIRDKLEESGYPISSLSAVVGRGGLLYPVSGGTFAVTDQMKQHVRQGVQGEHVSNLGALIADELASEAGCPAYIVDPVVVDEMEALARYTGHPELSRRSIFHALNQKAAARKAAEELGRSYGDLNLIVVHLGGGISVGCHCRGRVIDVNNALNGDGPFTPERSGGLPVGDLAAICYSGTRTHAEVKKMIKGQGGIVAYLGTNDMREVEDRAGKGDAEALEVYQAMAYQISKEVGGLAAVLAGDVDAVVLTGGIAYDKRFVGWIEERVGFLARVLVYPGEMEMEALALGALRVLRGLEEAQIYEPDISEE